MPSIVVGRRSFSHRSTRARRAGRRPRHIVTATDIERRRAAAPATAAGRGSTPLPRRCAGAPRPSSLTAGQAVNDDHDRGVQLRKTDIGKRRWRRQCRSPRIKTSWSYHSGVVREPAAPRPCRPVGKVPTTDDDAGQSPPTAPGGARRGGGPGQPRQPAERGHLEKIRGFGSLRRFNGSSLKTTRNMGLSGTICRGRRCALAARGANLLMLHCPG